MSLISSQHDIMLAWAMNDAPLARDHGYPLRLVVPGRHASTWVKWVDHISVVEGDIPPPPVIPMMVRHTNAVPFTRKDSPLPMEVRGVVYCGAAAVVAVALGVDGTWFGAHLTSASEHEWTHWVVKTSDLKKLIPEDRLRKVIMGEFML